MTKFILLFTLCSFQLQAQIENSSKPVDTETYFWFYVKLGKSPSKTTGMNRIYIKSISNIVNSGSFNQFIKSQQDGLIAGKIIIGPFHEGY